jgi:DNA topoisomerase 2-associated protein PAT1
VPHPFISLLSHPKGKKAIPRVFRHLDDQQRLTILTLIAVHLDSLDVVRNALPGPTDEAPSAYVRESIDIFAATVMGPLTAYVSEAPLQIIVGLLGLVLDRAHLPTVLRTRIGLSILTTLISHAELLKSTAPNSTDSNHYTTLYNSLFDVAEPVLPHLVPPWASLQSDEDVYVWQFLASMGAGANPEQQQRLVLGVKERVMETVDVGRAMPGEMGAKRMGHVNLFMRSIGLDVELLG